MKEYLDSLLILASIGNLICITAGLQAPYVFDWKNDLKKIHPFSRKILINYYFYIGSFVLLWSIVSFFYRKEILKGDPLAILIVSIMLLFWLARILVDFFWFKNEDWPKGKYYKIGHALLNGVFIFLVIVYSSVLYYII